MSRARYIESFTCNLQCKAYGFSKAKGTDFWGLYRQRFFIET